jgi:hypothetical protein
MMTRSRLIEIGRELAKIEREIEDLRRDLIARGLRRKIALVPPSCAPPLAIPSNDGIG